ncbi:MAG: zinc-binding dehydrogenase [Polyangiaceae bacterium]
MIGGGVIAFLTVWAIRELFPTCEVTLLAPEPYQRELAQKLGAHEVLGDAPRDRLPFEVGRRLGTRELRPVIGRGFLAGGYDRIFDCIGSPESLDDALRVVGPGGTLVLVGAAGINPNLDLTTVWTKEVKVEGTAYYGYERYKNERRRTFDITLELLAGTSRPVGDLITHRFPLDEYARAIEVNLDRRGTRSVKAVMSP